MIGDRAGQYMNGNIPINISKSLEGGHNSTSNNLEKKYTEMINSLKHKDK